MTTQIDHKEARRHLDVVRHGGGMTWMSDLDPLDIVEGLLDAYDDDISGWFTQEQVDEAIEEAKDLQKDELDKDHQKEIQRLKEEHDGVLDDLRTEHEQAIARLTAEYEEQISELRNESKPKVPGPASVASEPVIVTLVVSGEKSPTMVSYPTSPIRMETIEIVGPVAGRPPLDRPSSFPSAADLEPPAPRPKRPIGKLGAPRRARDPHAVKPPREPRAAAAPSSTGTLAVVLAVLAEAGIGVALSVNDIVARAGERLPTKSKTPSTVVSRDLALDIKRHGKASKFRRASAGIFRLAMAHELEGRTMDGPE